MNTQHSFAIEPPATIGPASPLRQLPRWRRRMRGIGIENGETRRKEATSETEPVEYDFHAHRSDIQEVIGAWLVATVVVLLLLPFA